MSSSAARAQSSRLALVDTYKAGKTSADAGPAAPLMMSIISLNKQRMYVYDTNGLVTTSRVSTGSMGYETPIGIYSVIQKKEDHASNLYEGAPMPHMQRLLWSGIALHGGEVPNYPASHGCVRLPWDFAERYFGMTSLAHRIIIAPEAQAPVRFAHPLLFAAYPGIENRIRASLEAIHGTPSSDPSGAAETRVAALTPNSALEALASQRALEKERVFESERAAKVSLESTQAEINKVSEAIATFKLRIKEAQPEARKLSAASAKAASRARSAQKDLAGLARRVDKSANRTRADKLIELRAQVEARAADVRALTEAADLAAKQAQSANDAINADVRMLKEANQKLVSLRKMEFAAQDVAKLATQAVEQYQLVERQRPKPISIFISSKTSRISLRQGFEPIAEGNVTIADPKRSLGTYIFTATGWRDDSRTTLDWMVAAVNEKGLSSSPRGTNKDATKPIKLTDARAAADALDRITIEDNILVQIREVVKPGSSLIISDYDMARSETSKGTDFVVQLPEVVAKWRSPQEIAQRKQRNNLARNDPNMIYYDPANGRPVRYVRPPKIKYVFTTPPPAPRNRGFRSSIPSFFGYYNN